MDETSDPKSEATPYMRLPWPLVAAGLLGVVVLALAFGMFANRYLRAQVGVAPTLSVAPVAGQASPTITATLASATPVPALSPDGAIETVPGPTINVTAGAPLASATPSPMSTEPQEPVSGVDPIVAEQVAKAYVMFWRVRSQALLELDPAHLSDVMDGDYLHSFETRLEELRAQGRAIKSQVTLNYKVVQTSRDESVILDRIEDDSFYVVPGTNEPLTAPANDVLRLEIKLQSSSGVWKVVESISAD